MQEYSTQISALMEALAQAERVVIGAGAGLSVSAGFAYSGERFERYFSDFARKYGFKDMYSGGFFPFPAQEEYWAYWSRYIHVNRYMDAPRPVYDVLLELMRGKDYFVITTNVDHCFQKAGFAKERLFYTQGDYGLLQCGEPCCEETFDNRELIERMVAEQKNMAVPAGLLPKCPHCGQAMTPNLRADHTFVEDAGWHAAAGRYTEYVRGLKQGKVLFLELGVGYNTPVIIKYPFWRMTLANPQATYACVNYGQANAPRDLDGRSICINADIGDVLERLL